MIPRLTSIGHFCSGRRRARRQRSRRRASPRTASSFTLDYRYVGSRPRVLPWVFQCHIFNSEESIWLIRTKCDNLWQRRGFLSWDGRPRWWLLITIAQLFPWPVCSALWNGTRRCFVKAPKVKLNARFPSHRHFGLGQSMQRRTLLYGSMSIWQNPFKLVEVRSSVTILYI